MTRRLFVLLTAIMLIFALCACSDNSAPAAVPVSDSIQPPQLSHQSGTYADEFILTADAGWGTTIRYTLDGSEPTADSTEFPKDGLRIYNRSNDSNVLANISAKQFTFETNHKPPRVSKGTVLRVAAFSSNGTRSRTVTETYLVGLDYSKIKVVSLVLDSASLFDYNTGIYVLGKAFDDWMASDPEAKYAETWEVEGNFSQKGRDWEREVLVQVFDENGELGLEQNMGIRIMGTATRRYYQKSFRLYAREEYGEKRVEYPLINGLVTDSTGEPLEKYKTFLLRNGGNDNGYAFLRDPFIQSLVTDRDFATQDSEPCIVMINGEYWGLYAITEDYSDNYIQYNYDVDDKNVIMIKNGELEEGEEDEFELYNELNDAAYSMDFNDRSNYEWLWERVDMQSFIDYMAVTIYINNEDGIIQNNNWRIWRARETDEENEYADGKWRFMLFDTDMSMGLYSEGGDSKINTLSQFLEQDWGWGLLFSKLMQVEDFRSQFINTFMDLRNTAFEFNSATEKLTLMKLKYAPYAAEQYKRNGPEWVIQWEDVDTRIDSEVNIVRGFVNGRYNYVLEMLTEDLDLGAHYNLKLSTNNADAGTVRVNTVTPDLSKGSWEGTYFSDYAVTLTAEPAEGYVFTGWTGIDSTEPTISVTLTSNTGITANFERE